MNNYVQQVLSQLQERNSGQTEFLQAAEEIVTSLEPLFVKNPKYADAALLERFLEPERIIIFRVPWVDDKGKVQVNRAFRVQYSSAIGPYKGGLRFHPSVNLSIIKFLGLEQILKNSLTGLAMGGGKGGSDFDPKGKSDIEVMHFCQSLVTELYRHVGKDTDVPAGDIGVGAREIGYIFGQYKRIMNEYGGAFTGKGLSYGGSNLRKEATGYGLVYISEEALIDVNDSFAGKKVVISGSGNVAIYAAQKVMALGGTVIAMSDSTGYIHDEKGINLSIIKSLKEVERISLKVYPERAGSGSYVSDRDQIWTVKCDIALPCATQNELNAKGAQALIDNGCKLVAEGANMPTTPDAVELFLNAKVIFLPGKAANAGGVAVSGLEMSQNSQRLPWTDEKVDQKLNIIMRSIYKNIKQAAEEYDRAGNFVFGANIAGFKKVADAMLQQGVV